MKMPFRWGPTSSSVGHERQLDPEQRTDSGFRLYADAAGMGFNEPLDGGEPEAAAIHALVRTAHERLEQRGLNFRGDAGAGVLDFEPRELSDSERSDDDSAGGPRADVLDAVPHEVLNDARDDAGSARDGEILGGVDDELDALFRRGFRRVGDDARQHGIERAVCRRVGTGAGACERQEVLDQLLNPLKRPMRTLDVHASAFVARLAEQRQSGG